MISYSASFDSWSAKALLSHLAFFLTILLIALYSFWIRSRILSDFELVSLVLVLDLSFTQAQDSSVYQSFQSPPWYYKVGSATLQNPSLLVSHLFSKSTIKQQQVEFLRQERVLPRFLSCWRIGLALLQRKRWSVHCIE